MFDDLKGLFDQCAKSQRASVSLVDWILRSPHCIEPDSFPFCVRDATTVVFTATSRSDQFCRERTTSHCCGPSGAAVAFVNLRLIVDTRSQLRSWHDQQLSVLNPKECDSVSIYRLSELKELHRPIFLSSSLRLVAQDETCKCHQR